MEKEKPAIAFRTITEASEEVGVPTHVLRFWEGKFTHLRPMKRAGGRRLYRPEDMALLRGLKKLLHDDGMTIKGVQKLMREQGISFVREDGQRDVAAAIVSRRQEMAPAPEAAQARAIFAADDNGISEGLRRLAARLVKTQQDIDRAIAQAQPASMAAKS